MMSNLSKRHIHLLFSPTAKNTYIVLTGNAFSLFFALLYTIIGFRILSYSDFGYFSAVWYFLLLISDISDLGIGSSLSRFLPPLKTQVDKELNFTKTAFLFQVGIGGVISLAIFFLSHILAERILHKGEFYFLFQVISVAIFAAILSNFLLNVLSARQQFLRTSILSIANGFFRLATLLFLFAGSLISLSNVILAQVISYIMLATCGLILVGITFLRAKFIIRDLFKLLSFSSFLAVAKSLTALASRLDVLMLVMLSNPVQAGIYSGAVRFTAPFPLFAGSFSTVLAPRIASITHPAELKRFLVKVISATGGLIGAILLFIIVAKPLMYIILGSKAEPTIPVLQTLLVSMIFFVASIPAVTLAVYYLKKPYILTINSVIQVIIVVIGNYFFIPKFGRFGPAYSLIIAYSVTLVTTSFMSYYYLRRKK